MRRKCCYRAYIGTSRARSYRSACGASSHGCPSSYRSAGRHRSSGSNSGSGRDRRWRWRRHCRPADGNARSAARRSRRQADEGGDCA